MIPIAIFLIEQSRDNKESIESIETLKEELSSCWKEMLADPTALVSDKDTRRIQDEIYKNRKLNQLIFDWLYKKYRDENEEAMNYSVKDLISEYQSKVSP
jgi:GTPase involved in cell partitioning and DNA repair